MTTLLTKDDPTLEGDKDKNLLCISYTGSFYMYLGFYLKNKVYLSIPQSNKFVTTNDIIMAFIKNKYI